MIEITPGMTGEYYGVHLVKVTFVDGEVKALELADDIKLVSDELGNVVSRPAVVVPVIASIGGPLMMEGPVGEIL